MPEALIAEATKNNPDSMEAFMPCNAFALEAGRRFQELYKKSPEVVLKILQEGFNSMNQRPSIFFLVNYLPQLLEWMANHEEGKITPLRVYKQQDSQARPPSNVVPWGSFFGTTPVTAGNFPDINSLSDLLYRNKVLNKHAQKFEIKTAFEALAGRLASLFITQYQHNLKHSESAFTYGSATENAKDYFIALLILYYFFADTSENKKAILDKLNSMITREKLKKYNNAQYIREFVNNATQSLEQARLQEPTSAHAQAVSDDTCPSCLQNGDNCTCEAISADAADVSRLAQAASTYKCTICKSLRDNCSCLLPNAQKQLESLIKSFEIVFLKLDQNFANTEEISEEIADFYDLLNILKSSDKINKKQKTKVLNQLRASIDTFNSNKNKDLKANKIDREPYAKIIGILKKIYKKIDQTKESI